jgi:LAS superfamily LD-carboxypeptidase LdcB
MMSNKARLSILLLLPLLAAGLLAGIGVQSRIKERARMEIQAAGRLLEACADTLRRHPELAAAEEGRLLQAYEALPAREQAGRLEELRTFSARLEMTASYRSWGRAAGETLPEGLAGYKTYSPQGFKAAGDSLQFPRAEKIASAPAITAGAEADRRLRSLAERRGYRLRWAADGDGLQTLGRHRLQPEALADWLRLQAAAAEAGVRLTLISGYRSPERQRAIFLALLREESLRRTGREYTLEEIAAGEADAVIDGVLASSSLPGYSKHHSGYALDIGDLAGAADYTDFARSRGFAWLSADNYYNAKRFGFLPSYPEGAGLQGPDPEAWEYIWVGEEYFRVADPPAAPAGG